MKKSTGNLVLTLCLTPFLMQCVAAEKEVKGLDLRMRTVNTRLVNMEKDIDGIKSKSVNQAEMGETLDRLNTQMLQVKGQLDESTRSSRSLQEENKKLKENVTLKLEEISSKLEDMNITIAHLGDQLKQANIEINEIKQARVKEASERALAAQKAAEEAKEKAARAAAPPASEEKKKKEIEPDQTKKKIEKEKTETKKDMKPPVTQEKSAESAAEEASGQKLYKEGISQFNAKEFKKAYNTFTEYIEKYPNGEMVANARFWRGDSLFSQKEFELAILEYQNVIADFSSHPKAPAALLKQGLAFEKLKEPDTAKIVYSKLLEEYPKSEQAKTAQKQLKSLK